MKQKKKRNEEMSVTQKDGKDAEGTVIPDPGPVGTII